MQLTIDKIQAIAFALNAIKSQLLEQVAKCEVQPVAVAVPIDAICEQYRLSPVDVKTFCSTNHLLLCNEQGKLCLTLPL